jgi:hypothetical protein
MLPTKTAGTDSPTLIQQDKPCEPRGNLRMDDVGQTLRSDDEGDFGGDWTDEVLKRDVSAAAVRRRVGGMLG